MPATSKVLMEAKEGYIKITGTDLSIMISAWVPALITKDGDIAVPAKVLNDYLSSVNSETVDLSREDEKAVLKVTADRSKVNINGQQGAEFPPAPDVYGDGNEHFVVPVDGAALRGAIQKVAMAAATEESRPILTGVQLKLNQDENSYTMAAADGFRLAVHTEEMAEPCPVNREFIIPAKSLQELGRVLSGVEGDVEIVGHPNLNHIMFRVNAPERVELTTGLLNGTFPEWSGLVPSNWTSRADVDANKLQRAVKSAGIFARDGSSIIRVHYGHTDKGLAKLQVSATSEELGDNLEGIVAELVEGEEAKIAFNHRYMQDAISAVNDGGVIIETTTPSSPAVFKPRNGQKTIQVVMPMFVPWENHNEPLIHDPELDDVNDSETAAGATADADADMEHDVGEPGEMPGMDVLNENGDGAGTGADTDEAQDEANVTVGETDGNAEKEAVAVTPVSEEDEMVYEPFDDIHEPEPAGVEAC